MASSAIVKIPSGASTKVDRMDPGFISVAAETLIAYGAIVGDKAYQECVDSVVEKLRSTNMNCKDTWPALHQPGQGENRAQLPLDEGASHV